MASVVLLIAVWIAACVGPGAEGQVIDGWPIGPRADCSTTACQEHLREAADALARRDGPHPQIVDVSLYQEGAGAAARTTRCCGVAVFTLADSTMRAIGVGKNIAGDLIVTVDYGP